MTGLLHTNMSFRPTALRTPSQSSSNTAMGLDCPRKLGSTVEGERVGRLST